MHQRSRQYTTSAEHRPTPLRVKGQRVLGAMVALFACALALVPESAYAGLTCKTGDCMLACNTAKRSCSLFPIGQIPKGYAASPYLPYGYKRTRITRCDRMVCATGRSCRAPVPIGQKQP